MSVVDWWEQPASLLKGGGVSCVLVLGSSRSWKAVFMQETFLFAGLNGSVAWNPRLDHHFFTKRNVANAHFLVMAGFDDRL